MISTTLDQALSALASLLFQKKTPSGELANRTFFIIAGVQRLYRGFDFDIAKQSDTDTTDADGILDIEELNLGSLPGFTYVGPGDDLRGYDLVPFEELYQYDQGSRKYSIIVNEDGQWEMHTTEPNTQVTLIWYNNPDISSSQSVPFTPMLIAKAALIYYRQAEDQDADTSLEEDQLAQEMRELIEANERRRPQRFAQSPRDRAGGYLGN